MPTRSPDRVDLPYPTSAARSLRIGRLLQCATAAALLLAPSAAGAVVFVQGTTHSINFDGRVSGDIVSGLTSSLVLTLATVADGVFTFDYTLTNTASIDSRTSSFGFASFPDVTGGKVVAGAFSNLIVETTGTKADYPGYKNIELCLTSGSSCSETGSGGALAGGASLTGRFDLYASGTQIDLTEFAVRYQSINATVDGTIFVDALGTGASIGLGIVSPVPEPSVWAMLIVGFGLVGRALRQQRRILAAAPAAA